MPKPAPPKRREEAPAYQRIAEALELKIATGQLRAGEPLGTAASLMDEFGVHNSTVREAMRMLERAGLVRHDSRRQLLVADCRNSSLAAQMTRVLMFRKVSFRELWEASLVFEIAAVERAAERATPECVAELDVNIAQSAAAAMVGHWATVTELDNEWHRLIGRVAGNRALELAREPALLINLGTTEPILARRREAMPRLIFAHRAIAKAIGDHDPGAAALWMKRHLYDWRRGFELLGHDVDQPLDQVDM
jgi:GntR family transcriptional repressor for pyruvate dehydrogenase complex